MNDAAPERRGRVRAMDGRAAMLHEVIVREGFGGSYWQCACGKRGDGSGRAHLLEAAEAARDKACWDALREANGVT